MADPPAGSELEDLVRRFSRLVRNVAARVGGSRGRQLADDVEQEVFLSIWKQLEREQSIDNPSSYIYRSAVRETIRLLKREGQDETTMDEHAAAAVSDEAPSPAERLFAGERGQILSDAIKSLPIDRRRAVQAYLAGYSVPEVMQMYGWSYERARNLSTRGMAELRERLKARGIDG
jgi:RNA polymerase sigma-70 factor (ECF subfamily)